MTMLNLWEGLVELMHENERKQQRPTWEDYWATVGSEEYLAAKALLELSSLKLEAESWLRWQQDELWDDDGNTVGLAEPRPELDWDAWITSYDEEGRGWSSTEHRLFQLVAALVSTEERHLPIRATLGYLGSWEGDALRILVEWASGGNNRDYAGRYTVVPR